MRADWNELQVQDSLGERGDMAVAGWAKRQNQVVRRGALSSRCICKEPDSSFVRCRKEVDYEGRMVALPAKMGDQEDCLVDKQNLEYFVVSRCGMGFWFSDRHEYWVHNCDFERCMLTKPPLTRTFFWVS